MSDTEIMQPSYAAAFQCIGPSCEDDCCHGWAIPVDRQTYEKYRQFPPDRLGAIVSEFVTINPGAPDPLFAQIHPTPSGSCAFHAPDRVCSIQSEYGSALLSSTCSIYPRALSTIEGSLEGSLHLSCPEAARNVLLHPDAMRVTGDMHAGAFRTDSAAHLPIQSDGQIYKPTESFFAIRELLLAIIQDRARSIEQRIMLIGAVCERLQQIDSPEEEAAIPYILADYYQVVSRSLLIAEMDALPTAPELQLNVLLKLMAKRPGKVADEPRFAEVRSLFLQGIHYSPASTATECTHHYVAAYRHHYQPFFARRPHSLENYLINYTYQNLFPFGRAGSPLFKQQSILGEYILMATHFAWLRALLIGVAGACRQSFSEDHVVQTVQSFCRAIEHQPALVNWMNQAMREFKLDTPSGMAVLLRL